MKLDDKYIYSACSHPVKVKVFNPITRTEEVREFPCGKCLHCRITKVEEWSTRMICESTMYAHVYYITLTYDPSKLVEFPQVAKDTHAVVHSFNYKHIPQLAPLTLCKRHTQLFWKRLRKATSAKLSYYLVGEYGHNYGRPHYHAIVWTDDIITHQQFVDAWQLCEPQSLKVVDLRDNKNIKDQLKSFRYVTKYLFKDFKFKDLPTYSLHRNLSDSMALDDCQDYSYADFDMLHLAQYRTSRYNAGIKKFQIFDVSTVQIPINYETQKDCFFIEKYVKAYGCFSTCSRQRSIGSRYLAKYADEYKKGDLRIFGIHTKDNLVFPSFFVRKAKEMVQPCKVLSDKTGNPRSCVSASDLLAYVDRLQDFISDVQCRIKVDSDGRYINTALVYLRQGTFDGRFDFYDTKYKQYYIFVGDRYCVFHWDKSQRDYILDCVEMLDTVYQRIKVLYQALFDTFLKPFDEIHRLREQEKRNYIDTVFGSDDAFYAEVDRIYAVLLKNREIQQQQYKLTKTIF